MAKGGRGTKETGVVCGGREKKMWCQRTQEKKMLREVQRRPMVINDFVTTLKKLRIKIGFGDKKISGDV